MAVKQSQATLFTIGFTRKSAERFFTLLRQAGVRRVLDIRLNNSSQLAGFTKAEDLPFFLSEIGGIDYVYLAQLAPTQEIVDMARKQKDRVAFEKAYRALIEKRQIEKTVDADLLDAGCLLCSEDRPEECHRRIAAEYLAARLGNLTIAHLV